jgi:EmrB/QacA subfamily drug resistance transporter
MPAGLLLMTSPAAPDDSAVTWPLVRSALGGAVGSALTILSAATLNIALDHLIAAFDSNLATVQWLTTGYLLTLSLALPLTGWMSARFGIRRLYLGCLVGFTLTSALCALSWSIGSLMAFRLLQGIAGGLLAPLFQTIVAQIAGPNRMGRLMSLVAVPISVMPMLGPVVGGMVIEFLPWRWLFLINLPLALPGIWVAWRYLPAGEAPPRRPLDWIGLMLASPGLAALTWGISEFGHTGSLAHPAVLVPLLGGALMIVGFLAHVRRRTDGLIDLSPFRRPTYTLAGLAIFVANMVNFGGQLLLPLYLQQALHLSPLHAGLLLGMQGIGTLVGILAFGWLADRYNPGTVSAAAGVITFLGTLVFAFVAWDLPLWLIGATLAFRGFGMTGTTTPALAAGYRGLTRAEMANASTVLNMVQRMGAPLGTAILAVALQWRLASDPAPVAFGFGFALAAGISLAAVVVTAALARAVARTTGAKKAMLG